MASDVVSEVSDVVTRPQAPTLPNGAPPNIPGSVPVPLLTLRVGLEPTCICRDTLPASAPPRPPRLPTGCWVSFASCQLSSHCVCVRGKARSPTSAFLLGGETDLNGLASPEELLSGDDMERSLPLVLERSWGLMTEAASVVVASACASSFTCGASESGTFNIGGVAGNAHID